MSCVCVDVHIDECVCVNTSMLAVSFDMCDQCLSALSSISPALLPVLSTYPSHEGENIQFCWWDFKWFGFKCNCTFMMSVFK